MKLDAQDVKLSASCPFLNMNDQIKHYSAKLAYEIDSWDLKVALENGEPVIVAVNPVADTKAGSA